MWATGGTLYCAGEAGARLGVRNSGAVIVAEGASDYPFEYMTEGEAWMLGDFVGKFGSRMTGGIGIIYDPSGLRRGRIDEDYLAVAVMDDGDLLEKKSRLEDYFKKTDSELAGRILENWEQEKFNLVKVVPKDAVKLAQVADVTSSA